MARHYFFSHGDRRALLVLALLFIGVSVVMLLLQNDRTSQVGIVGDSLSYASSDKGRNQYNDEKIAIPSSNLSLRPFDPNTADSTTLLSIGLSRWQVANVYKYRNRGGVFRKPSDFARLYGLTVHQYKRLEPYIRISPDFIAPASSLFPATDNAKGHREYSDSVKRAFANARKSNKINEGEFIDLNVGDTVQLKRVPGIGSYFARKILQYGQRLGGYVDVAQLDEIEDFPYSAKSFFVVSSAKPQKLNVNKLSLSQLRRHPYINYYQARAIVDYRRTNGPFRSLHDLAVLPDITQEDIRRLASYVEF
ncbi:MAG: ComEA family DNA-binding protein [Prevotella sp.]